MILDPRHLSRPSCFDGTEGRRIRRLAIPASLRISQQLTHASEKLQMTRREEQTMPFLLTDLPPDDEGQNASLMLYSVIVGCIKNRPLRLIMKTESHDGREALRKPAVEYKSTYRSKEMALQTHHAPAPEQCTVKTATRIEEAAPHLQEHLQLRSEEVGTDWKKVVLSIEGNVRSKKSWDSGGPADMDIGAVNKRQRPAQRP